MVGVKLAVVATALLNEAQAFVSRPRLVVGVGSSRPLRMAAPSDADELIL